MIEKVGASWHLRPTKGPAIKVQIRADLPPDCLAGVRLEWKLVIEDGVSYAKPTESPALRDLRDRYNAVDPGARQYDLHFGLKPAGSTILEKSALIEAPERIQVLLRQNDLSAWSELASAVRVKPLRRLVLQALGRVGWRKIEALVKKTPSAGWDPELFAWFDREREKASRPRPTDAIRRSIADGEYGFNPGD